MHVDADAHAQPRTRKQINQRNSKADSEMHKKALTERCSHTLIHKHENTHSVNTRTVKHTDHTVKH